MQWSKFIYPALLMVNGLIKLVSPALAAMAAAAVFISVPAQAAPAPGVEPYTRDAKSLFDIEVVEVKNKAGDPYYIYFAIAREHLDPTRAFYTLDGYAFTPKIVNILAHVLVHHEYGSGYIDAQSASAASDVHDIVHNTDSSTAMKVPVIVGISHSRTIPFVTERRTWDFTPVLSDDLAKEFPGGGGDQKFMDFLINDIKKLVAKRYPDIKEDMLFGHSFAGLLVLNMYLQHHDSFSCYYAASPSLWWGYSQGLRKQMAELYHEKNFTRGIIVSRGSSESSEQVVKVLKARNALTSGEKVESAASDALTSAGIPWPKEKFSVDGRSGAGLSSLPVGGNRQDAAALKERHLPAGSNTTEAVASASELTVASPHALEVRRAAINTELQIMNLRTLISVLKSHSDHPELISFVIFAKQSHGSSIPFAIESALKHFADRHMDQ